MGLFSFFIVVSSRVHCTDRNGIDQSEGGKLNYGIKAKEIRFIYSVRKCNKSISKTTDEDIN